MGKATHVVPPSHGTVTLKKQKVEAKSDKIGERCQTSKPCELGERCRKTSRPFEIIYSNWSGKAPIASLTGALYYITFIDDFTRAAWCKWGSGLLKSRLCFLTSKKHKQDYKQRGTTTWG